MIRHGKITMENGQVIPFELYEDDAPITVKNFVDLIQKGYYDGKTFHRVIPGFVSQGGCPYGNGTGDLGYTLSLIHIFTAVTFAKTMSNQYQNSKAILTVIAYATQTVHNGSTALEAAGWPETN